MQPLLRPKHTQSHKYCTVFKEEVCQRCNIGALHTLLADESEEREWALPYFGMLKKIECQLVINSCQLNQVLKRKKYPLPTIKQIFQKHSWLYIALVIDLNMGYSSIPLTEPMWKLLTIMTMFEFFKWCVLLMGIKLATDIFLSQMVSIFTQMRQNKPSYIFFGFGNGYSFDDQLTILSKTCGWLGCWNANKSSQEKTPCHDGRVPRLSAHANQTQNHLQRILEQSNI